MNGNSLLYLLLIHDSGSVAENCCYMRFAATKDEGISTLGSFIKNFNANPNVNFFRTLIVFLNISRDSTGLCWSRYIMRKSMLWN